MQLIFSRCLARESEAYYLIQVLIPGVAKGESELVKLSKEKLSKNGQYIRYLIGQIKAFHQANRRSLGLKEGFFKYDGTICPQDYKVLFQLYALALGGLCFRGFGNIGIDIATLIYPDTCKPTLSPKDRNFPEWWEVHKVEWETEQ